MPRIDNQYNKDIHLSNIAQSEWNKDGYAAQLVLPRVMVGLESGKITNNGKQGMRIVDTRKGERAEYNHLKFDIGDPQSYAVQYHGLLDDISNREIQNWKHAWLTPLRESKIRNLIGSQLNSFEKAVIVDVLSNTAIMTNNTTLAGTDQWSDYTNSTPIKDIRDEIEVIEKATGERVTRMVIAKDVLNILADHPNFTAKLGTATGGERTMTQKRVIKILEDEYDLTIIVPSARYYDDADAAGYFFTKQVALLAGSPTPTLDGRDFGKTFSLGATGPVVMRMDASQTTDGFSREISEIVKVKDNRDPKVLDVDCSFLFDAVIA